ncbi:unnamed protein product, partial [Amoebophrya sp. A25]
GIAVSVVFVGFLVMILACWCTCRGGQDEYENTQQQSQTDRRDRQPDLLDRLLEQKLTEAHRME